MINSYQAPKVQELVPTSEDLHAHVHLVHNSHALLPETGEAHMMALTFNLLPARLDSLPVESKAVDACHGNHTGLHKVPTQVAQ